jgi:hypothetical protein
MDCRYGRRCRTLTRKHVNTTAACALSRLKHDSDGRGATVHVGTKRRRRGRPETLRAFGEGVRQCVNELSAESHTDYEMDALGEVNQMLTLRKLMISCFALFSVALLAVTLLPAGWEWN